MTASNPSPVTVETLTNLFLKSLDTLNLVPDKSRLEAAKESATRSGILHICPLSSGNYEVAIGGYVWNDVNRETARTLVAVFFGDFRAFEKVSFYDISYRTYYLIAETAGGETRITADLYGLSR